MATLRFEPPGARASVGPSHNTHFPPWPLHHHLDFLPDPSFLMVIPIDFRTLHLLSPTMTERTYLPAYESLRQIRWAEQGSRDREFLDPIRDLRQPREAAARQAKARLDEFRAKRLLRVEEKRILLPQPDGCLLGIGCSIVRPPFKPEKNPRKPCIVFLHGGALVGSTRHVGLDVNGLLWVEQLDAITISVEYERPPWNQGDGPANQCYQLLLWVWRNRRHLGILQDKIILYGASAGGGLAASVGLMLRRDFQTGKHAPSCGKQALPRLAGILLEAPMLEDRNLNGRWDHFASGPFFSGPENKLAWTALLGNRMGTDQVTEYEAPGRAVDLAGFGAGSSVFVEAAGEDMFFQEDIRFATKLRSAGVDVEFSVLLGCPHGFAAMSPDEEVSRQAVSRRLEWMKRTLRLAW
jgi:acetyl esterase/lipase